MVELPRLRLSFEVRAGGGADEVRLYSREHAGLYLSQVSNPSIEQLLHGLPHAVALQGDDGDFALLVSAAAKPVLTADGSTRLHRGDPTWLSALPQARHYLYPIHPSGTHLCSPTLASSLYLLLLYFLHRMYAEVFQLVDACMTDTELSMEELQLWEALQQVELLHDAADAHAARLKLHLTARDTPTMGSPWRSPLARSIAGYVQQRHHVSANCRLSVDEEVFLLREVLDDEKQRAQLGAQQEMLEEHVQVLQAIQSAPSARELQLPARSSQREQLLKGARWFDLLVRPDQMLLVREDDQRIVEPRLAR